MPDALSDNELLEKYNPVLIVLPQRPGDLERPGARFRGKGRGDYHPCSIEFFMDRAYLRTTQPELTLLEVAMHVSQNWKALPRTRLAGIQRRLAAKADPEATRRWELDVADVPSQDEKVAWSAYAEMLQNPGAAPYECVVYARCVECRREDDEKPTLVLQYWYLYLYNDFRNNHEADWEMAAIELDKDQQPVSVGYSRHFGGGRLSWPQVLKAGDRPAMYVARGSHAGYFSYKPDGFRVVNLKASSTAPWPFGLVVSWLKGTLGFLLAFLLEDKPPADSTLDPGAKPEQVGVRVDPKVCVLPSDLNEPGAPWWLQYRGRWGSGRPRMMGAVGVATPWRDDEDGVTPDWRWHYPLRWLDDCKAS